MQRHQEPAEMDDWMGKWIGPPIREQRVMPMGPECQLPFCDRGHADSEPTSQPGEFKSHIISVSNNPQDLPWALRRANRAYPIQHCERLEYFKRSEHDPEAEGRAFRHKFGIQIQFERWFAEEQARHTNIMLPPSEFGPAAIIVGFVTPIKGFSVAEVECRNWDDYQAKPRQMITRHMVPLDSEIQQKYDARKTFWQKEFQILTTGHPFSSKDISSELYGPRWKVQIAHLPNEEQLNETGLQKEKLYDVARENMNYLSHGRNIARYLPVTTLCHRQALFVGEILWRCRYIKAFRSHIDVNSDPICCDPHLFLGPDIDLDLFIFQRGILKDDYFGPIESALWYMYGFGAIELAWLKKNSNRFEFEEQWTTMSRYHLLQRYVGREHCEDLVEQFKFCYYAIRDSRGPLKVQVPDGNKNKWVARAAHQAAVQERCAKAEARRREFKIAKVMVDMVWNEVQKNRGLRVIPLQTRTLVMRGRDGGVLPVTRQGDWDKLNLSEKMRLLGKGRREDEPNHPEYSSLCHKFLGTTNTLG